MFRKSKQDWLRGGAELLRELGPQSLTIDALCQHMQVTKGSFYHHFAGIEAFKLSLLTFYEEEGTLDIITQLTEEPSAQAKLHQLANMIVVALSHYSAQLETMIRAWALQDEVASAVQRRVDGRRRDYVMSLCLQISGDAAQATIMANMIYAIYVGSQQLQPPLSSVDVRDLFDEFFRLYNITANDSTPMR